MDVDVNFVTLGQTVLELFDPLTLSAVVADGLCISRPLMSRHSFHQHRQDIFPILHPKLRDHDSKNL